MTSTPPTTYVLETGCGDPLRFNFTWATDAVTALDLLPAFFSVADAIHTQSRRDLAEMGKTIGCGPGCSTCCHQLVPVSEYEALHLANIVRSMPTPQQTRITHRFMQALTALEESDLLIPLTDTYANHAQDKHRTAEIQKRYWDLKIPCPFLEANCCSIHAHRPLACRQYLVTSAPAKCSKLYSEKQDHEIVLHSFDTGGALASFSGEGIQNSRILPHILSLLAERSIRKQELPSLSPQQMMSRFLMILTTCFARKA